MVYDEKGYQSRCRNSDIIYWFFFLLLDRILLQQSRGLFDGSDEPPSTQCYDCVASEISGNLLPDEGQVTKYLGIARKISPFIRANSAGEAYVTGTASQMGLTNDEYDRVVKSINDSNSYVIRGFLTREHDNSGVYTSYITNQSFTDYFLQVLEMEKKANGGTPQYADGTTKWWGYAIKYSNAETEMYVDYMTLGLEGTTFAAAVAAAAGVSIKSHHIAAAILAGTGFTATYISQKNEGKGVTIGITWAGVPVVYANK
ncbi:hypothetical protein LCY76_16580 [Fictibacillus sp. KIGAM418]|uniref:Uncharacterized protein n=1 Tax=Fictibacillus marinisediminis TaxID=2878389 RepID=A0A9X2BGD1_9BACL|nr:hypothetical protein [Fictibacillus marinisediminis]MCK6258192.1 hypothetical protein [Fictibacillus marinisediminis]